MRGFVNDLNVSRQSRTSSRRALPAFAIGKSLDVNLLLVQINFPRGLESQSQNCDKRGTIETSFAAFPGESRVKEVSLVSFTREAGRDIRQESVKKIYILSVDIPC